MDYKYDAFISYRHAEKDTRIASEIQKSLERFNIPAPLRKKTGKQRFNRVFRDVEELPITSNLTEEIEEALRVSEHLIVICSYRTSESDWVKREIDTFLELHDYNKQLVLTVLVEGEPDEVIPEVLRHDNITHYLADGSFYCRDEVVEPLSADYRMPIPKARKTELPRLAASMLGCNYDEIIRRRKAYKRTRLLIETAIVSIAAIVLLTYIGWMLMRIQDNYRRAQMNQSRYLATESQKLLDDGDRLGAVQLALAAMVNTDGSARPVTSEARYALSEAIGSYSTKGTTYSSPIWRYETASTIVGYYVNSTYERFAVLDASGKLNVWNLKDHTLVKTLENKENRFLDFRYDKNDNIIVANTRGLTLYDSKTWEPKWNYTSKKSIITQDNLLVYYADKDYIALNCGQVLFIFDANNGSVLNEIDTRKYEIFAKESDEDSSFSIRRFAINNDYTKLAVQGTVRNYDNYAMYVYDFNTDKWSNVIDESGAFHKIYYDDDGSILVVRRSKDDTSANYYNSNDTLYDASVIIERISSNGKSAWQTPVPVMTRIVTTILGSGEYTNLDGSHSQVVLSAFGNKFVIIDKKSGRLIKTYDLPDSAVKAGASDTAASVLTRSGLMLGIPLTEGAKTVKSSRYFKDGVINLANYRDENKKLAYLVEDDSKKVITEYSASFSDTKFKDFAGADSLPIIMDGHRSGKYLIAIGSKSELACIDMESKKVLWQDTKLTSDLTATNISSPDHKYFYYVSNERENGVIKYKLVKLNCTDGKFEKANSEFSVDKKEYMALSNGKIWGYSFSKDAKLTLLAYDMTNDTVKKTEVDFSKQNNTALVNGNLSVSPDGKKAVVYFATTVDNQDKFLRMMIDCDSGKFTETVTSVCQKTIWSDNGKRFAEISGLGVISVFSADGKQLHTIDTELRTPKGIEFFKDKLYVLYSDDVLCGYDALGKQVVNVDLNHGDLAGNATVSFEFVHDYLFITAGRNTDIINLNDGKVTASLAGFLCIYDKDDKDLSLSQAMVVCHTFTDEFGSTVGYFDYKTPEKLIEQAKDYLKGNTVSEEFKRKYGLD